MGDINAKLKERGNFLAFSETITTLDSAKEWEPKAPAPEKRMKTLKLAHENVTRTLLAIRPLLPIVSNDELKRLIDSTKDYTDGYYSGPLYLKDLKHPLLEGVDLEEFKIEQLQPHWMPDGNIFYKIEKLGQMELLKNILQENRKLFFDGAAEAIKYFKLHEKH